MAMPGIERIGNVYYRVHDFEAAVSFYGGVLGLPLKFRDGDNWAAFDVAGVTLGLEPGGERVPAGTRAGATVSLRVSGIADLVTELRSRGAQVSDIRTGAHEYQADLTDPSGNVLVLYEPLPRGS
jgi:predicted enzyme related to lactoylglutathione lyase